MMMNGKTVNVQYSQTVTHEAPFTGNATAYSIGKPVFLSGKVCKWDCSKKEWSYQTSPMDCICEVKPNGTWKEYIGICVAFVDAQSNYTMTPDSNTVSILFASHGDFYFTVDDSSKYSIGDTILYDGRTLHNEMVVNNKVLRMTVGVISAKIDATTLAIFRD